MRLAALFGFALTVLPLTPLTSQTFQARSLDYLFTTNAADVRALWVNPAGLAIVPEASVLAELSLGQTQGHVRLDQFSLGFNTRGISLGYQRNRHLGESSVGILRAGLGIPIQRGAIGFAAARYSQDSTSSREADFGLIYVVSLPVQLGAVIRHIGRPVVRGVEIPIATAGSIQWTTSRLQLNGETIATERRGLAQSGFEMAYRAGARLAIGNKVPFIAVGVVELASNVRISRFSLGVSVGGARQFTSIASIVSSNNDPVLERFSGAFTATNPLAATR